VTVRQLADRVGGEVVGDGTLAIRAARPLAEAEPGDITFVDDEKYIPAWNTSRASAAVVGPAVPANGRPLIRVADPLMAFATIVLQLRGAATTDPAAGRIDPTARIHPTATFAAGVTVGPFAVVGAESTVGRGTRIHAGVCIGSGCTIGDEVTLFPHVVLYDGCRLGNRVVLHSNAVIGADGFGYRTQGGRHIKVPQLGGVEIADDVEIGACSTIDRGTFGPTRIGQGTKIDNLVMVGHNCQIGRHNLLAGQVGIAGSCSTGDYVVMAGQVGMADHLHIGAGAVIGAQSGLTKDVPPAGRFFGTPAVPLRDHVHHRADLDKLARLRRDLERIVRQFGTGDES
jgi:UDP-3-O-[3-hydroxymyristoyl] glucosamine N-acyltransferase